MIEHIIIKGYRLFGSFEMEPRSGVNIIVGDNDAGKSSLLEAITLGLTGRLNGRWIGDELNPYCFNAKAVKEFFEAARTDPKAPRPEILIELYLSNADDALQPLRGKVNSLRSDQPGLVLRIYPTPDYEPDFEEYLLDESCPAILPVEYYTVEWRSFADQELRRRPKGLGLAKVDSKTIRSSAGIDYHTRQMLAEFIDKKERASISIAHRKARHGISTGPLTSVNARIAEAASDLFEGELGLHMDMSANASWEFDLVPQIADVPFAMVGHGQQAAIKVALAMHRTADSTRFVLVEEPENHMSHTSLTKLVDRVSTLAADRQVFVTTHSSFVLNRLGLDALTLLHRGRQATFGDLPTDTVQYFRRLSGYDTLRIVLANTVVLVEGPSDEITFSRAHQDRFKKLPMDRGIDIVSMQGVALRRGLELCHALDRRVAALRDNDGQSAEHWREPLAPLLKTGVREVFIGSSDRGKTLEPQLIAVNNEHILRTVVGCPQDRDLADWLPKHKTEAAVAIADAQQSLTYPDYFEAALDYLT